MTKEALLIFTKNPEPGQVKTRLAATLGNEAALSVYKQLLLHTVAVTRGLTVDRFVFYSNHIEQQDIWGDHCYHKQIQQGNDLGERMANAFISVCRKGYHKVVIIGTDCPELNGEIIMNAFDGLKLHDVIIGPAHDGGYYLLGMKQPNPVLFQNIAWSTSTVLDETLKKCAALQLDYGLLPVLRDIDEEKDLEVFKLQS